MNVSDTIHLPRSVLPFNICYHPQFTFNSLQQDIIWSICLPQTGLTILLNIFILVTFARNRQLRHPQHYYFLNLAFCDLIIGSTALPARLTLDLLGCWPTRPVFCRIYKILDWTVTSEAATTMILIAYSRYKIVSRGAHFTVEQTSRKVIRQLVLSWFFNATLYVPVQFLDYFTGTRISGLEECNTEFFQILWLGDFLVILNNVLPPVAVFCLYGAIAVALRRRKKVLGLTTAMSTRTVQSLLHKVQEERSVKQTRTMLILTLAFLVTSLPCGICSIVMFAQESVTISRIYLFSLYLLYGNSLVNTIIYTSKVPAMRSAVRQLFCWPAAAGRFQETLPMVSIDHRRMSFWATTHVPVLPAVKEELKEQEADCTN